MLLKKKKKDKNNPHILQKLLGFVWRLVFSVKTLEEFQELCVDCHAGKAPLWSVSLEIRKPKLSREGSFA